MVTGDGHHNCYAPHTITETVACRLMAKLHSVISGTFPAIITSGPTMMTTSADTNADSAKRGNDLNLMSNDTLHSPEHEQVRLSDSGYDSVPSVLIEDSSSQNQESTNPQAECTSAAASQESIEDSDAM